MRWSFVHAHPIGLFESVIFILAIIESTLLSWLELSAVEIPVWQLGPLAWYLGFLRLQYWSWIRPYHDKLGQSLVIFHNYNSGEIIVCMLRYN